MILSDDEVSTHTDSNMIKSAIEGGSKDNVDESAIEGGSKDNVDERAREERESDWEDDDSKEASMFHRVESKSNLKSHRSLLTTALQEGGRTRALQNEAFQSTSVITRTRTTEPNGPSIGNSPQEDGLMMGSGEQKTKPIIMTTSNVHSPAMSLRMTRRLLLTQEPLWEREQKNNTIDAVAERQQSAISPVTLRGAATTSNLFGTNGTTPFIDAKFNSLNYDVYSAGLDPYHSQGW
jgi:hypothetical protein